MKNKIIKFVIALTVGLFLVYLTFKNFEIQAVMEVIKSSNKEKIIFSVLFLILSYLLRGIRWRIWESSLSFSDSFKLILIGFMGNNIFPFRLGELLRVHCTAKKTGDNYGRTSAAASVVIERVFDGLVISIIGIIGLFLIPVGREFFYPLMFIAIFFGSIATCLIVSICFHNRVRRYVDSLNKKFPGHLTRFGKEKANYFFDGLMLLDTFPKFLKAFFMTFLIWGIELGMYFYVSNAFSGYVSIKICLLFLAVVNFASLFPLTIGGIGAIEGAATAFLIAVGIQGNIALAMVITQHFLQYMLITSLGLTFYFTDKYYKVPLINIKHIETRERLQTKELKTNNFIDEINGKIREITCKYGSHIHSKTDIFISIIIPTYNEQNRLPKTLLNILDWTKQNAEFIKTFEIIIVDDGSSDQTGELARLFSSQVKEIRYIFCPHHGKGATVRMGMLNAFGKYVIFMDADGATPMDELRKVYCKIQEGYDVVIGSRIPQYPGEIRVTTRVHRKIMGRIFSFFVNVLTIPGFADTQCGFKMFKNECIRDIFQRQRIEGFAFDIEVLYIAKNLSLEIYEVPVNWVNQKGSKVNIIVDSMKMLIDLLRIRWIHKREKWDLKYYAGVNSIN